MTLNARTVRRPTPGCISAMIKYFIYPGRTRSRSDGDIHEISAKQLIDLYGVNPAECKIIRKEEDERGYDAYKITRLRPRMDGNYSLLKKYEVGIMSSKWIIEAPSLDVATMVVRISQQTNAPVVCYNSDEQSKFAMMDGSTEAEFKAFCDDNIDEIRIAYRNMEQVS